MTYITTEAKKLYTPRDQVIYFLSRGEACPESDTDRLATLRLQFGVTEWVEPVPVPLTPAEITANKKSLIATIANAAQQAVESQANAALQIQMWTNYKSATPHPYIVANVEWGKSIYLAAEQRKAQVQTGVADDAEVLCNFSSFGDKPYTVYQLYVAGVVEL